LFVVWALSGCSDAAAPSADSYAVLVGGGGNPWLSVVDPSSKRVTTHIGFVPTGKLSMATDTSRRTLYTVASDQSDPLQLVKIDLGTRTVVDRTPVSTITAPGTFPDLQVIGAYAIAPTPDGRSLLIDGVVDSVRALALVDLRTLKPIRVFDSLAIAPGGLIWLSRDSTTGVEIGVLGRRVTTAAIPDFVFVLSTAGDSLVDSIPVNAPHVGAFPAAVDVVSSPGSRTIFVATPFTGIARFNVSTHAMEASAPIHSPAPRLSLSPDGERLYLTDGTDGFDNPGSGLLGVFDSFLDSVGSIDLRPYSSTGTPPVLVMSAVSQDGQVLYVTSGTADIAGFTPQPARLFIIRLGPTPLISQVQLSDWVPGGIVLFRCSCLL